MKFKKEQEKVEETIKQIEESENKFSPEEVERMNGDLSAASSNPYEPSEEDANFARENFPEQEFTEEDCFFLSCVDMYYGNEDEEVIEESYSDRDNPASRTRFLNEVLETRLKQARRKIKEQAYAISILKITTEPKVVHEENPLDPKRPSEKSWQETIRGPAQPEYLGNRIPPNCMEQEKAVLGLIIKYPDLLDIGFSQPYINKMFYHETYKRLHKIFMDLGSKRLDELSLEEHIEKSGLDYATGEYLKEIIDAGKKVPRESFMNHVMQMEETFLRREMVNIGTNMLRKCYDPDLVSTTEYMREVANAVLDSLPFRYRMHEDLRAGTEIVLGEFENHFQRNGRPEVSTGYKCLDRMLHGFRPKKLHVFGGDTKMGKTTLIANLVYNVAQQGHHAAIFSYNSSREDIIKKLISKEANIDSELFEYYEQIKAEEVEAIKKAGQKISQLPIAIESGGTPDIDHVIQRVRALKNKDPDLALVVIDEMQSFKGFIQYHGKKADVYSEILRNIRSIADESEVSVLLPAQIATSNIMRRKNCRPYRIDDFADCKDLPKFADTAFFIYRHDAYFDNSTSPNVLEIIPAALRIGDKRKKACKLGIDLVTSNIYELPENSSDTK
jgi:replicative DNA helicase